LAGDLQQAWANRMLLHRAAENGVAPELTVKLALRLQDFVHRELISGEALDVEFAFIGPERLTAEQVNRMLYLKTGVLLRFCAETGAMIALNTADPDHPRVTALGEFATQAGIAFQYRDDWLGLYGDQAEFGKPIGSDLAEAKPTMLLIRALKTLPPPKRSELLGLLGRGPGDTTVLNRARTLIRDSGAETAVRHETEQRLTAARECLMSFPDNRYRRLLAELLDYMVGRTA
ncbi:MAG: polyprenyl synthetase family protein, partial [Victivallales bacterium]|nr:polyprenyl synthetase family protein [Victivallales bacterium]